MANFVLNIGDNMIFAEKMKNVDEHLFNNYLSSCVIYGNEDTFCVVRNGEDVIASIGYACFTDARSAKETLLNILTSFHESQIGELKKRLVGQYLLIIKKGNHVNIFSDIMGARNIFYSKVEKEIIFSSSFSQVENLIEASPSDLDLNKVLEFLAVKQILYPAWLGQSTENKRIKWLLPYEYIAVDLTKNELRIGAVVYQIDNRKNSNLSELSNALLSSLGEIVYREEFMNSLVSASLTGGRDSRLVAAITANKYDNVRFRTAVSKNNYDSRMDLKIAKKIARISRIPLDCYDYNIGKDEERFSNLTERLTPLTNQPITSLILNANKYSMGYGGVFGTELFMPIPWESIDDYINKRIENAKLYLHVNQDFWNILREDIYKEFRNIKAHYQLIVDNEQDYIRLFIILVTSRFGSFIISAFNSLGYQLEPYGCYRIMEIALQVAPNLWGNHRKFGGNARIQAKTLSLLNKSMAQVITYKTFRPMLPLSITSSPLYIYGFLYQLLHWLKERYRGAKKGHIKTNLPGGYFLSNGWEISFLKRTADIYGLPISSR